MAEYWFDFSGVQEDETLWCTDTHGGFFMLSKELTDAVHPVPQFNKEKSEMVQIIIDEELGAIFYLAKEKPTPKRDRPT